MLDTSLTNILFHLHPMHQRCTKPPDIIVRQLELSSWALSSHFARVAFFTAQETALNDNPLSRIGLSHKSSLAQVGIDGDRH